MHFRSLLLQKGGEKETHGSSGNSQNFHLTPGEVNQFRGITDTYASDTEHRSMYTEFKGRCL